MLTEHRHIKLYGKEIFELKEQGLIQRQIGEKLGFHTRKCTTFSDDTIAINEKSL